MSKKFVFQIDFPVLTSSEPWQTWTMNFKALIAREDLVLFFDETTSHKLRPKDELIETISSSSSSSSPASSSHQVLAYDSATRSFTQVPASATQSAGDGGRAQGQEQARGGDTSSYFSSAQQASLIEQFKQWTQISKMKLE